VTRLTLLFLLALVAAAGCGGSKPMPEADVIAPGQGGTSEEAAVLPEPQPYTMAIGDLLNIKFFYYPEYDFTAAVRPDGMVTVPLLGEVKASGVRPKDLESLIRARYADVLAEPEVTVMVTEFASQRYFVFGEVVSPGAYALYGNATLLDAIAQAGNIRPTGRWDSVILMRKAPDGSYVARKVDVEATLSGRDTEVVYLLPADIIYVPMSAIAKVDEFVDQFFNRLTPVWRFYILGRDVVDPKAETFIGQ
jgi:polysaccharide export outer membrane protein